MSQDEAAVPSKIPTSSSKKRLRDPEHCTHRRMRVKFTSNTDSSASDKSISDESALIPTSVPDESTDASEFDTDSESELSESSEEPSSDSSGEDDSEEESELEDESEDGDRVVNLRSNRGKKPSIKLPKHELGEDLRPFLEDFLPQLRAANEELEAARQAGTLKDKEIEDDGKGDGQYVEMNLGLGVLEEKNPDADASSHSESDSDSDTGGEMQKDIMGKLLGRDTAKEPAGIQDLGRVQGR